MKESTKQVTTFECEKCHTKFSTQESAEECERQPISHDKGVVVGDKVRIITGQGQGLATVTSITVIDKSWGHHAWKRYWHTIGLSADCEDQRGSRFLTYDDYEIV